MGQQGQAQQQRMEEAVQHLQQAESLVVELGEVPPLAGWLAAVAGAE